MLGTLSFISVPDDYVFDKPYEIIGIPESEVPADLKTNITYKAYDSIEITDLRDLARQPTLAEEGFIRINSPSAHILDRKPFMNIDDDHGAVHAYLEETNQLLKEMSGASWAFVYDWRYRKNGTVYERGDPDTDPRTSRYYAYAPIEHVHADYSSFGAMNRRNLHLSRDEKASVELQNSKIVFFNAWRPLVAVENAPLALCDRRTVKPEDVILVDKVLPNNVEEETCIRPRDYHRWYYVSKQTVDEILIFVQWEDDGTHSNTSMSALQVIALPHEEMLTEEKAGVPHAAVSGPAANIGAVPRESVEVRMIAVFEHVE